MSEQYPGGFITQSSAVAPTFYAASGIWTMDQCTQAIQAGAWPGSPDPYFKYVTMLLHCDGTNAATNNTFLDSSTNSATITRAGNTTQGTFTPYGDNWSNLFDGSATYIQSSTTSAALGLGTGDYTAEVWVYLTASLPASPGASMLSSQAGGGFGWRASSTGMEVSMPGVGNTVASDSFTIPTRQWVHLAVARQSSVLSFYMNGVRQGATKTDTNNYTAPSADIVIGRTGTAGAVIPGNMSNLRLVKGTAVYSGASFTVPTAPLTAISGTSLLTCQSNRFIDTSTTNLTLTPSGGPSVQRFSPFSPTAAYSTSTVGGSGYFDGTGDYLTMASSTAWQFSTGAFTVECWFYPLVLSGTTNNLISNWVNASGSFTVGQWELNCNNDASGQIAFVWATSASAVGRVTSGSNYPKLNAWNHIAVARSGTTITLYLNGVSVGSGTMSTTLGVAGTNAIGYQQVNSAAYTYGFMTDARIVKGTAVYTTAFTPPTAPLTAVSNTSVLLNFTNAGIYDSAEVSDLETVGSAQVSTSVVKYGTGSLNLTSASSYAYSSNSAFAVGTGDFTVEMWIFFSSNPSGGVQITNSLTPGGYSGIGCGIDPNTSYFAMWANGTYNRSAVTATTSTWYHIAQVRTGGSSKLYVNGTLALTVADTTSYTGTICKLGGVYNDSYLLIGYIDEFRFTNGYARYTSNFTPPNGPFPSR